MNSQIWVIYTHRAETLRSFLGRVKEYIKIWPPYVFPRRNQQSVSSTIKLIQKVNEIMKKKNISVGTVRYFNGNNTKQGFGPVILRLFEKYVKSYQIDFETDHKRFPGSPCGNQN